MNRERYDHLIVGAGIVGLATARKIQRCYPDRRIAIIEKEENVALHQSGRNSGVLHSGIYYAPGSLKARNCISGYHQMLEFCRTYEIDHEICGKVIVATDAAENERLKTLAERCLKNGLDGLKWLSPAALKKREPHVQGHSALLVPQSGIVDYTAVAHRLRSLLEDSGVRFFFGETVTGLSEEKSGVRVNTPTQEWFSSTVTVCAGLHADRLSKLTASDRPDARIIPFRGEYYELRPEARPLVRHLVYPVPDPAFPFLGVHFTRRIDGRVDAGPNAVLALAREGYHLTTIRAGEAWKILTYPGLLKIAGKHWKTGFGELHRSVSKRAFTRALQKLIPEISASDLLPAPAGVRAQAVDREGRLLDDFRLDRHGRILHVINAPSPAATSAFSIAETILSPPFTFT